MADERSYWLTGKPACCDICRIKDFDAFVDGKILALGMWGIMCETCHGAHGVGLGLGKGQKYVKEPDGKYYKV